MMFQSYNRFFEIPSKNIRYSIHILEYTYVYTGEIPMPTREGAGRPVPWKKGGPERRLYDLIPEDGSLIWKKDLKKAAIKVGMSMTTFHKYLKKLERNNTVLREVDSEKRPLTVYYRRLTDEFFPVGRDFYQEVVLGAKDQFKKHLLTEKNAWQMEESEEFLASSLGTMCMALGHALIHAWTRKTSGEAREYVEVTLKTLLLPWIQRLVTTGQEAILKGDILREDEFWFSIFVVNIQDYFLALFAPEHVTHPGRMVRRLKKSLAVIEKSISKFELEMIYEEFGEHVTRG